MDPITTGLGTNLLAAGLLRGKTELRRKWDKICRDAEFYAAIDAIETEFHRTLRAAIETAATEQETDALAEIVGHWDAVVERLAATGEQAEEGSPAHDRLVFETATEAVDQLAREIAAVCGYDLETNPQLQQALKRAVAEAYREAVGSFGERLVDAGLADQFVAEANIEELAALDRLQDRLADVEERLTHPRFYELYRGDADGRRRASRMIDPQALEFVSRPELKGPRTTQRLLVLGPGGSGKSRVLADLVAQMDREIEHIIRPTAALQNAHDLQPFRSESFQGDVLLVWDDIHAISPETNNTVFRKAITELEAFLAPEHELHVLAAARSNRVESLPGEIEHTDSPLWSAFETVELGALSAAAIGTLFDRLVAKEGVVASEEVRTAFVEKAQATAPSPLYVTSVVETVDGLQLTTADIDVLPEDARSIWQEQYTAIKDANDERRFVLWAVKLLAALGPSVYHHSLLKGVYAHVLNRDELTFEPPVETLCHHQWLVPRVDAQGETWYVVHDVKAEAIDESIDGRLRAYSTFLFEAVDEYLPTTEGIEHQLHEDYAGTLHDRSLVWDTQALEQHCEQALALNPECASAHYNYANILWDTLDRPETAQEYYERVLDIDSESAEAHTNYANLLSDALDAPDQAKEHYERALDINSEFAEIHTNYALLLSDTFDAPDQAKEHYERALDINSEFAEAHYNYANLLKNALDAPAQAKEHYEQALDINSEDAKAHTNYACLLGGHFDRIEDARRHFEQALTINPELGPALNNYAILLRYELDAPEEATRYFEQGIAITDDPTAHYYYGRLLLDESDAPEEAKPHLERALQAWQDVGAIADESDALRALVRVCRALGDEGAATKYCERARDLAADHPAESRWFEGTHALLTETDCRTRYTHGLTTALDEDWELSKELFEVVWTTREDHPPDSPSHDVALSAGVVLAALAQCDGDSPQTGEEILTSIEPAALSPAASILYEHLDTGTVDPPEVSTPDAPPEDRPLQTLERQAVAQLLDTLAG